MKIIQSHAQFKEGSPYLKWNNDTQQKQILNFYSFLLSYITLKKNCGEVTMFCNKKANESLIKYIPYDNVIVKDNYNTFKFWNKFKLDSIKSLDEDCVHFDSDVFIFDEKFKNTINSNWDVLVQDILPEEKNFVRNFLYSNSKFFKNGFNYDISKYDGRCVSCGVFGLRKKFREEYFRVIDIIYDYINDDTLKDINCPEMIYEELMAYIVAYFSNFKIRDVLPHDLVLKYGVCEVGNLKKYTHLWLNTKYNVEYIKLIKNKIKKDYPEYYSYVIEYEKKHNVKKWGL